MGRVLGGGAERVLAALSYNDQATVDYRSRTIELPLREVPANELAAARRFLKENPEPLWKDDSNTRIRYDWIRAALLESVHLQRERDGTLAYEMQVMRIGDCAFVGLPGEPFAWGGLQIKMGSPAPFTFIVHGISSYAGYIPPRLAYPRGGHEVDLSYWAKVAPGSLETIIEVAGEMLGELFA
jgi:hypothetical protein